jgi:hypothetical protein
VRQLYVWNPCALWLDKISLGLPQFEVSQKQLNGFEVRLASGSEAEEGLVSTLSPPFFLHGVDQLGQKKAYTDQARQAETEMRQKARR